jgi:hypothetical protein
MRAREADRLRADCERRARALDATTETTFAVDDGR